MLSEIFVSAENDFKLQIPKTLRQLVDEYGAINLVCVHTTQLSE